MRSLQSSSNSTAPTIKSTYDSTANELSSKFMIEESLQQYKNFNLELTSNGIQSFVGSNYESYVVTTIPVLVKVENPKIVEPKNKYKESEDMLKL